MPRPSQPRQRGRATRATVVEPADLFHSQLDHPCCRLLAEAASSLVSKEAGPLATAVRRLWEANVRQGRQQQQQQNTKKKRRKKKKKKNAAPISTESVDESLALAATESVEDTPAVSTSEVNVVPSEGGTTETVLGDRDGLIDNFLNHALQEENEEVMSQEDQMWVEEFCIYLSRQPCAITDQAVQQCIDDIACLACRQELVSLLRSEKHIDVLSLEEPPQASTISVENAFDYEAMEQGLEQPAPSRKGWGLVRAAEGDSSSPNTWNLVFHGTNCASDPSDSISWSSDMFSFFLRHGVLLPGTHPDKLFNFSTDSNDATHSLVMELFEEAKSIAKDREQTFYDLGPELCDATATFEADTKDHAAGGNIEMSAFPIMKKTDEICCRILDKLLDIVQETTSITRMIVVRMATTAGPGHNGAQRKVALDLLSKMWTGYLGRLQDVLQHMAKFDMERKQLANSQGSITDMFCSATLRSLYRELVHRKILATHGAISHVREILDSPLDVLHPLGGAKWNVAFFQWILCHSKMAIGTSLEQHFVSLDQSVGLVLKEATSWIQTVHQPTVSGISAEYKTRLDRLLKSIVAVTYQSRSVKAANGPNPQVDELFQRLDALQSRLNVPADDSDGTSVIPLEIFELAVTETIHSWIRCGKSDSSNGTEEVHVPYDGRRLVAFDAKERELDGPCHGGDPRKRISCISSFLVFQWMQSKYHEWSAGRAEELLLTELSMESEKAAAQSMNGSKKSAKKKKSKKQHTVGAPPSSDDPVEATNGQASDEKGSSGEKVASTVQVDSRLKSPQKETERKSDKKEETELKHRQDEGESSEDAFKAGVIDSTGTFVPAETFLREQFNNLTSGDFVVIS